MPSLRSIPAHPCHPSFLESAAAVSAGRKCGAVGIRVPLSLFSRCNVNSNKQALVKDGNHKLERRRALGFYRTPAFMHADDAAARSPEWKDKMGYPYRTGHYPQQALFAFGELD